MGKPKNRKKRKPQSVNWRPAGLSKAEMRIVQMAKHFEKCGNTIGPAELKAIITKVDR